MPIGAHGNIRAYRRQGNWRAQTTVRDLDGITRYIERRGGTKTQAVNRLRQALLERRYVDPASADITADTPLAELAEAWWAELCGKDRSPRTLEEYRRLLDGYVLEAIGRLRIREFRVSRAERFLKLTLDTLGPSNTKTVRTILSGMLGLAARHDAIEANPIRDTSRITIKHKKARALTMEQARDLRIKVHADERAIARDLPDLVDLLLGTGVRIGEALAVTWNCLDLDVEGQETVEIRGTVIRIKGKGLVIKPEPKSEAGFRTLKVPSWAAAGLRARRPADALPTDPVYPAIRSVRDLRDPSSTTKHLRVAFDDAGYEWVTSHIAGRKTVATEMDRAGLSARLAADQLGHANISTTQKHYFGRERIVTEGADVMEQIVEPDQPTADPTANDPDTSAA